MVWHKLCSIELCANEFNSDNQNNSTLLMKCGDDELGMMLLNEHCDWRR